LNIDTAGRQTLRAISKWQASHNGKSPSYAELAKILKISTASIHKRVVKLREAGALKAPKRGWRSLEIAHPDYALKTRNQLVAEIERLKAAAKKKGAK
jgi:DNA-binding Lrp family transcriptional regulator